MKENLKWEKANNHLKEMMKKHPEIFDDEWFENWKHRRPDEHLWHFNAKALRKFVESQKYEYINSTNVEDCIRKTDHNYPNILTAIFKKIR